MNIRTASFLAALLLLVAPLSVMTPLAQAQTELPLVGPKPNALLNPGLDVTTPCTAGTESIGEITYDVLLCDGFKTSYSGASLVTVGGSQAVNLATEGATPSNVHHVGLVAATTRNLPRLVEMESMSAEVDVPMDLSRDIGLLAYIYLDSDGDGIPDQCLITDDADVLHLETGEVTATFDDETMFAGSADDCKSTAEKPLSAWKVTNPLWQIVRIGFITADFNEPRYSVYPADEPVYVDNLNLRLSTIVDADSCTDPDTTAQDTLWGLLCAQIQRLDGIEAAGVIVTATLEDNDVDQDDRRDVMKVEVAFPTIPADDLALPNQPIFVQLDYFYTPPGSTPPYEIAASNFERPVTGLMLYDPHSGELLPVPNQPYRFTDHYQDQPGWFAIYTVDATHYGPPLVAHNPARNDLDSNPDATTRIRLDLDGTPYLGTGCAGRTKFAGQPLQTGQCENSIDEGTGGGKGTPTWIQLQVPGKIVPQTQGLFFDGRGIMLDDLHVKWPSTDAENTRPDFATFALGYSNLDNDADTDYQELSCPTGDRTNPTNPATSCDDVDGDGIPRSRDTNDKFPDPAAVLSLRATKADGTAIPTSPLAVAPLEVDLLYKCTVNRGTLSSVTLNLGWQYNGLTTAPNTQLSIPTSKCDGAEHSVGDLTTVGGPNPVYVYLKSTSTPTLTVNPQLSAVHSGPYTVAPATTSFKIEGAPVDITFTFFGNQPFAPVDLTGSKVSCREPAAHAFQSGALDYGSVSGDQLNNAPSTFTCPAAGADTFFSPTLYHNGADRFVTATGNFAGANVVVISAKAPIANLAETGTLVATGCGQCYSNSPSITWTLTPTSLGDEGAQGWESVELKRGGTTVGTMSYDSVNARYELSEGSRTTASSYSAVVTDAGHRVSSISKTLGTQPTPNAIPTVSESRAPQETAYNPDADLAKTTVDMQFFVTATDAGPTGRPSPDPGESLATFKVRVEFLTATDLNGAAVVPVPAPVILAATSPSCPSVAANPQPATPAVSCPRSEVDGKTQNGELFRGTAKLSPLLAYTYRYTATDGEGALGASGPGTLKHAINAANPAATTPADATARPLSFAFLLGGGAVLAVTSAVSEQLADLQAGIDQMCGRPTTIPGGLQPCAETVLYETVCGLTPGTHQPTDLADCKDGQEQVANLIGVIYDVAQTIACEDHNLTGDCASWRVGETQDIVTTAKDNAIALIFGTVCAPGGAPVLCTGLREVPVLDPEAALTGRNGCNFFTPEQWIVNVPSGSVWSDSCNSRSISDPSAVVTDLLDLLLEGDVPVVPLPVGDGSSHNLPDASGRNAGSNEAGNGQDDFIESRVLGYRFDGESEDSRDPFDGGNEAGVTLFVGNLGPQSQITNPTRGFTVRLGDVAGTPMQELLVVEDVRNPATPKVTCVVVAPSPGTIDSVYVREGGQLFRQNGNSPLEACGPTVRSGALRYDYFDLQDLASGSVGLMVWEDRDGSGSRVTGDDADARQAGLPSEDILGFRLQASPNGPPVLRMDVNQGGTVTTRTTTDDGFVARILVPKTAVGPGVEVPALLVGSDPVQIEADVYSQQGGVWAPHAGPVTLYLQRDCQILNSPTSVTVPVAGTVVDSDNEARRLCLPDNGDQSTYTVAVSATASSPGHYRFVVDAALAKQRLFARPDGVTMLPVSAAHVWIQQDALVSNYAVPTRVMLGDSGQPSNDVLASVDRLDANVWTPVPLIAASGCDPNPTAANPTVDTDGDGRVNACDMRDDADPDSDGRANYQDNCPTVANADQANLDNDAQGNACDTDDDNDGKLDGVDSCGLGETGWTSSSSTDMDGDGCRDASEDLDDDADGHLDTTDNCPAKANADQADADNDGSGDVCDPVAPADADGDTIADTADNCPNVANTNQLDSDGDANGNACDDDDDNDSFSDADEVAAGSDPLVAASTPGDRDGDTVPNVNDNCPTVANAGQANNDGDSEGDACDTDDDNDGDLDNADNCPTVANANQANNDGDAEGDLCDPDDDNDTVPDSTDYCPNSAAPVTVAALLNGCPDQRAAGPTPEPCSPPQTGIKPTCNPPPALCPPGQIGVTSPACVNEPDECTPDKVGAGPACVTPPMPCLADDPVSCVDDVGDLLEQQLCTAAGAPTGSLPGCLAGAPDAVRAAACLRAGVCDADADGIPDAADRCAGANDLSAQACPPVNVLYGIVKPCGSPGTIGVPGVRVCSKPEGGPLARTLGLPLPGLTIDFGTFSVNL